MKIKVGDDVYTFDPAAITLKEVQALNLAAGLEVTDMLSPRFNDPRVLTAVIWLCRTRPLDKGGGGEKKRRYEDVDTPLAQVLIDWDEPTEESPTEATLADDASESQHSSSESPNSSEIPASGS